MTSINLEHWRDRVVASHDSYKSAMAEQRKVEAEFGQYLSSVRATMSRDQFEEWVTKHFDFSYQVALRYMRAQK